MIELARNIFGHCFQKFCLLASLLQQIPPPEVGVQLDTAVDKDVQAEGEYNY